MTAFAQDPFDARVAHAAPDGPLRAFNEAGVLAAADVHVARRLAALAAADDPDVLLAVALAVRAPRLGHVFVDLATIARRATTEGEEAVDLSALPWPAVPAWLDALGACPALVAVGEDAGERLPLRLVGTHLYLDRYWREEQRIAADLRGFAAREPELVNAALLDDGLDRLRWPDEPADSAQVRAARTAVHRRFTVVAGGPGTGKTTTVARIVALLHEQAADGRPPLIALAAPTGKAAARLEESLHEQAPDLDTEARDALLATCATTLHRLLGWRPDSHSRFRHHRGNRLPHDVVIVDETSMVSLSLMGRLVEAVRPDARLILVGDPDQLTSVEAGAVLGDVVGPAAEDPGAPPVDGALRDAVVVLDTTHRFGGAIADLAAAIRSGDPDAVLARLAEPADPSVRWIPLDAQAGPDPDPLLAPVRDAAVAAGRAVLDAARAGDPRAALAALGSFRVLTAHRRGPYGATPWMWTIERWLTDALDGFDPRAGEWYVGRPLLVTENDHSLRLYNGDTGVVIAGAQDRVTAAFERRGEALEFSPTRLSAIDTVYAMTIHKAQGSQFDTAAVLLPGTDSPILTRELLYTGVTRASQQLVVVGTEEAVRGAVSRPAARASALRERLWD
ncbi:exodeoxyribonuclease V subunit alpha [Paraconexibacter algicola]|uniref:exodeoxyribonuclease V subunit alpha n=1 Tax=Paraconexibacter algicola TaxID=2133960 RepID=UPI0018EE8239|nr:exodeoxyribonuclease V subunit alpha [Paraconexibacter algicola]